MTDCIFCKVIAGELPGKFAYQDDDLVVIHDINPKAQVHLLLIPREHVATVSDLRDSHQNVGGKLLLVARDVAKKLGVTDGYRLVVNNGADSGQIVPHLHMHLLGGWKKQQKDF